MYPTRKLNFDSFYLAQNLGSEALYQRALPPSPVHSCVEFCIAGHSSRGQARNNSLSLMGWWLFQLLLKLPRITQEGTESDIKLQWKTLWASHKGPADCQEERMRAQQGRVSKGRKPSTHQKKRTTTGNRGKLLRKYQRCMSVFP